MQRAQIRNMLGTFKETARKEELLRPSGGGETRKKRD